VLDTKPKMEKIPSEKINSLLQIQFANSETIPVQLIDLMTMLTSPTTSAVLPIIEVDGEGDNKIISLSGTAVFKQDKMVGELNREETRGLLWINGKAQSGILKVEIPEGKADIEMGDSKSTLKSEFKDGKLIVTADIKEECTIGSQTGVKNLSDVKTVQKLEDAAQQVIRDEITRGLQKAKDLHADIYGFGELVHKKYPSEWKSIEKNWDSYFQNMELDVSIKVMLRASGRITQPVAPPEKEE
jgi:germination protein, Ger(x)C family